MSPTSAAGPDWAAIAARYSQVTAEMLHHEAVQYYGDDFYVEALRRTFDASSPGDPGHRVPYDTVSPSTGLMTCAEADHIRDGHTVIDRLNAERAKEEARAAREETRRVLRDAARDLAAHIRARCNDRTVPARYRRQGVLLAADWIDPDSPYPTRCEPVSGLRGRSERVDRLRPAG